MRVLDYAVDSLLCGSHGWLHIPLGGNMDITWMPTKKCYRLTVDVTAGHLLDPEATDFFVALGKRLEKHELVEGHRDLRDEEAEGPE